MANQNDDAPDPKAEGKRPTRSEASVEELKAADRDKFVALGRFIQEFELVISVIREDCAWMIRGGELRTWDVKGEVTLFYWNMTALPLHHEVMSAKPLTDIWRALLHEYCKALVALKKMSPDGQQIVDKITTGIVNEIGNLADQRNRLVHATWYVGRWTPFEDIDALAVEKYKVSKDGLQRRNDLPQSTADLIEHGAWAHRLVGAVGRLAQFVRFSPDEIEKVFEKRSGKWLFVPSGQVVSPTSPEKPR